MPNAIFAPETVRYTLPPHATGEGSDEEEGDILAGLQVCQLTQPRIVVNLCRRFLSEAAQREEPRGLAVAFDIDDTLLRYADPEDRGSDATEVFVGFKKVYDKAISLNMKVLLITARPEEPSSQLATRNQLARHGLQTYHDIAYCPPQIVPVIRNIGEYKAAARARLEQRHRCKIVMNVGDQWSDLLGNVPVETYERLYTARPENHDMYILFRAQGNPAMLNVKLPHAGVPPMRESEFSV